MVKIAHIPWMAALQYGCDPDGKRIREYARFTAETVEKWQQKSGQEKALLLSGGFTDLRFPGISEAMMMERLIRDMGFTFQICREEQSLTTIQNIRNVKNYWIEKVYREDSVAILAPNAEGIICDKNRVFKVAYIARVIFGEKIPVIGFDFHRTKKENILIAAGTMKDLVAVHSARVEKIFLEQRRREIGIA